MLYTKYHFAREYCRGKQVLELACGAGPGLAYLARHAWSVVGGDVDETNLAFARAAHRGRAKIDVRTVDAHRLPLADDSLDTVILYDAIHHLRDAEQFVAESRRVLRPGGNLLVCTVNCDWEGFQPRPGSVRYFSAAELTQVLVHGGFYPRLFGGFPERRSRLKRRAASTVSKIALKLKIGGKAGRGRQLLKRIAASQSAPLGYRIDDGIFLPEPLSELSGDPAESRFKMLYIAAAVDKWAAGHAVAA